MPALLSKQFRSNGVASSPCMTAGWAAARRWSHERKRASSMFETQGRGTCICNNYERRPYVSLTNCRTNRPSSLPCMRFSLSDCLLCWPQFSRRGCELERSLLPGGAGPSCAAGALHSCLSLRAASLVCAICPALHAQPACRTSACRNCMPSPCSTPSFMCLHCRGVKRRPQAGALGASPPSTSRENQRQPEEAATSSRGSPAVSC